MRAVSATLAGRVSPHTAAGLRPAARRLENRWSPISGTKKAGLNARLHM